MRKVLGGRLASYQQSDSNNVLGVLLFFAGRFPLDDFFQSELGTLSLWWIGMDWTILLWTSLRSPPISAAPPWSRDPFLWDFDEESIIWLEQCFYFGHHIIVYRMENIFFDVFYCLVLSTPFQKARNRNYQHTHINLHHESSIQRKIIMQSLFGRKYGF